MKAKLIRDMGCVPDCNFPDGIKPSGTIIDHPECYRLVRMGCAEAFDGECAERAGYSPDQLEAARIAYNRVALGIHPDDYEAFDAGMIIGYNPDGTYKPGPNWEEVEESDENETPENEEEGSV